MENRTDDELLRTIQKNESDITAAKRNIEQAKEELLARRKNEINALLADKDEPFGDVNIVVGNYKVKVGTPKKVDWAQDMLADKYREIAKAGDNPAMYMDVKYNVSETAYKKFPQEVREFFEDARTVKAGTQTIKIVEE